ncbi:MAG: hypothetical protein L6R39_003779 [Caloplaca ligustica]|nr:MAG: hypothetical protein L6R39_003779 [Caloplaca ligustica]
MTVPSATISLHIRCILKALTYIRGLNKPLIPAFIRSRVYHYRGIVHLLLDNDSAAFQDFDLASRLRPDDDGLRRHRDIIQCKLATGSRAYSVLRTMAVESLPYLPLMLPEPVYRPSEYIANERYLLRKLNYNGDMLSQIPEKKPADIERMEKVFKALQAKRLRRLAKGGDEKTIVGAGGCLSHF